MRVRDKPPKDLILAVGGIFFFSAVVSLIALGPSVPKAHATGLALDGTAYSSNGGHSTSVIISLTTAQSSDVVIVIEHDAGPPCPNAPTSASLTFTARSTSCTNEGVRIDWAIASSPGTFSITCNYPSVARDCLAFGVSGANTATPFDPNAALTCFNTHGSGSSTIQCTPVTTSTANDFIFASASTNNNQAWTAATGYAMLASETGQGGDQYKIVSSTQSSITLGWNGGSGISDSFWDMKVDAIQQSPAVSKVQTKNCTFTASSAPTCQFASNVASGDVGVASIETTVQTSTVTSVSDGTHAYALIASESVLSAVGLNAVYCWNYASLGTTPTITFTLGATATGAITLYDLSNAAGSCNTTGSDDSVGRNVLSSSMSVASYTPSSAGLEIGFFNIASTVATFTVGASFTKDNDATSGADRIVTESIANSATAATTPATLSIAAPWNEISVTFVMTAETLVTQPLVLCIQESGAPTGISFSMFGGSVNYETILTVGTPCTTLLSVTVDKNSPITIEVPTDTTNTRWRFNSSSDSALTAVVNTCATGTCTTRQVDVYYELQNTATAAANAQANFDPAMTCDIIGTLAGAPVTTLGTITSTAAASNSANYWADYNNQATFCTGFSNAPAGAVWPKTGTYQFTHTGGGNTDTVQYWKQLSITYQATPVNPTTWDGSFTILVTGYQFGVLVTGCFVNVVAAFPPLACSTTFDYNTQVTMNSPVGNSATKQWVQSSGPNGNKFTDTVGGGTDNVNYGRQWQVAFSVSPALSGTISPTATTFYNDGTNGSRIALTAAAYTSYEFSSWSGPAGMTFSATAPYTASANVQAAGTITANFASSTNNQQIGGGGYYAVTNSTTSLGAYTGPPNPISGLAAEAIVAIVIAIAGIAYFESHQNHVKVFRSYMGLQPKRREPRKERGII